MMRQSNNVCFSDDGDTCAVHCMCGCYDHGGMLLRDETVYPPYSLNLIDRDDFGMSMAIHANFHNRPRKERWKAAWDVLLGRSVYLDFEIDTVAVGKMGAWLTSRFEMMEARFKEWSAATDKKHEKKG